MEAVQHYLSAMQLHPVVDHFTVSLLIVAVLIDLLASLAPTRLWMRNTAVTLMILGALAAGLSYFTGDIEADRIWNALGGPAKEVLKRHAQLGEYLAIAFGVLALWRIMIALLGFMSGSLMIYLIVAFAAICVLGYSAHLGGVLVYDYGAGTALMAAAPVPNESASPGASPSAAPTMAGPLPTVSVPTPGSTSVAPYAAGAGAGTESSSPAPMNTPSATPTPTPSSPADM